MELLTNDLSVHEQFQDIATFREAFSRVMALRNAAGRYGRAVHCNGMLLVANPIPDVSMQQAIMTAFPLYDQHRAAMIWLTQSGPFWDDIRQRKHAGDDYRECGGDIVTDHAIGEAAFRKILGVDCGLVSFSPSDWELNPVEVVWRREAEGLDDRQAALENWWNVATLEDALEKRTPPIRSWDELRQASTNRFESLFFADDCFEPLLGIPFARSSADRFVVLLKILDRFARAFADDGTRNEEGHRIYQDYFTGKCAPFSDSSDTEKNKFSRGLTFPHPEDPARSLCCTWHGKIRHLTLRLHFSWPVVAGSPVYVVYAGPKITKR